MGHSFSAYKMREQRLISPVDFSPDTLQCVVASRLRRCIHHSAEANAFTDRNLLSRSILAF